MVPKSVLEFMEAHGADVRLDFQLGKKTALTVRQ
jgi:hypothetical protein